MLSESILVVATIARTFDALGIRYLVGGSVASSVYGIPRATQDVDLVADIQLSQVDAVTKAMAGEFYVDADMIRDAIRRRASFNIVHLETMFKADIFVLQRDSWSREEMARARSSEDRHDAKGRARAAKGAAQHRARQAKRPFSVAHATT